MSKLEIVLQRPDGSKLYTEPFDIDTYGSDRAFTQALGDFEPNARDAIRNELQDLSVIRKYAGTPDSELLTILRRRGYDVKKF